jgi:hypothetical protein
MFSPNQGRKKAENFFCTRHLIGTASISIVMKCKEFENKKTPPPSRKAGLLP